MPSPVSATVIYPSPCSPDLLVTVTVPPGGVWRRALSSRLPSTWPSRSGSTVTIAESSRRLSKVTPLLSNRSRAASTAAVTRAPVVGRYRPDAGEVFLGARDRRDVLGEPLEPVGGIAQDLPGVVVEGADAVVEGFEIGVECGDGSAHLVAEVGQHPAARVLGGFETASEFVDGDSEFVEFATETVAVDARVVVTVGDLRGRRGHRRQRALDTAGDVPAHARRQQHRDRDCQAPREDDCPGEGLFDVGGLARVVVDTGLAEMVTEDARGEGGGDEPGADGAADHHRRSRRRTAGCRNSTRSVLAASTARSCAARGYSCSGAHPVADAADGAHVAAAGGVVAEFAAQMTDVHVDQMLVADPVRAPHRARSAGHG